MKNHLHPSSHLWSSLKSFPWRQTPSLNQLKVWDLWVLPCLLHPGGYGPHHAAAVNDLPWWRRHRVIPVKPPIRKERSSRKYQDTHSNHLSLPIGYQDQLAGPESWKGLDQTLDLSSGRICFAHISQLHLDPPSGETFPLHFPS